MPAQTDPQVNPAANQQNSRKRRSIRSLFDRFLSRDEGAQSFSSNYGQRESEGVQPNNTESSTLSPLRNPEAVGTPASREIVSPAAAIREQMAQENVIFEAEQATLAQEQINAVTARQEADRQAVRLREQEQIAAIRERENTSLAAARERAVQETAPISEREAPIITETPAPIQTEIQTEIIPPAPASSPEIVTPTFANQEVQTPAAAAEVENIASSPTPEVEAPDFPPAREVIAPAVPEIVEVEAPAAPPEIATPVAPAQAETITLPARTEAETATATPPSAPESAAPTPVSPETATPAPPSTPEITTPAAPLTRETIRATPTGGGEREVTGPLATHQDTEKTAADRKKDTRTTDLKDEVARDLQEFDRQQAEREQEQIAAVQARQEADRQAAREREEAQLAAAREQEAVQKALEQSEETAAPTARIETASEAELSVPEPPAEIIKQVSPAAPETQQTVATQEVEQAAPTPEAALPASEAVSETVTAENLAPVNPVTAAAGIAGGLTGVSPKEATAADSNVEEVAPGVAQEHLDQVRQHHGVDDLRQTVDAQEDARLLAAEQASQQAQEEAVQAAADEVIQAQADIAAAEQQADLAAARADIGASVPVNTPEPNVPESATTPGMPADADVTPDQAPLDLTADQAALMEDISGAPAVSPFASTVPTSIPTVAAPVPGTSDQGEESDTASQLDQIRAQLENVPGLSSGANIVPDYGGLAGGTTAGVDSSLTFDQSAPESQFAGADSGAVSAPTPGTYQSLYGGMGDYIPGPGDTQSVNAPVDASGEPMPADWSPAEFGAGSSPLGEAGTRSVVPAQFVDGGWGNMSAGGAPGTGMMAGGEMGSLGAGADAAGAMGGMGALGGAAGLMGAMGLDGSDVNAADFGAGNLAQPAPGEVAGDFAGAHPELAGGGPGMSPGIAPGIGGDLPMGDGTHVPGRVGGQVARRAASGLGRGSRPLSQLGSNLLRTIAPGMRGGSQKLKDALKKVGKMIAVMLWPVVMPILVGGIATWLIVGAVYYLLDSGSNNSLGQSEEPLSDCLKVSKTVDPASISNDKATEDTGPIFTITIEPTNPEKFTAYYDGGCSDTLSISCGKDSKDCTAKTEDLTAEVCDKLRLDTGETDGSKEITETITLQIGPVNTEKIVGSEKLKYTGAQNYSMINTFSIQAHCKKKEVKDGEKEETEPTAHTDSAQVCIGDEAQCASEYCWPVTGDVSQIPFQPGGLSHSRKDSVDIHNNNGFYVYAPFAGKYTYKWDSGDTKGNTGCGCYAYSYHDGMLFMFCHMKRSICEKFIGSREYKKGQIIGVVDHSGHSTGPHLHLEVAVTFKQPFPDRNPSRLEKLFNNGKRLSYKPEQHITQSCSVYCKEPQCVPNPYGF